MDNKIQNINNKNIYEVKKVNNEKITFDDQVEQIIKDISARAEREVPEYGDFAPVTEFMPNLDKGTTAVSKYGLTIYKMPKDVVADPKKRYIQAAAYMPAGDYKATLVVGSGDKKEILEKLNSPDFPEKLNDAYAQLLELLEGN